MAIRTKYIQTMVGDLLRQNRIKSAPVDVEQIAKNLGIVVEFKPTKSEISGFLFRDHKNNKSIIGVNKSHHENRQRFTLAHEIGHFVLHKFEGFHFDGISLRMRDENSSKGTIKEEREANKFASELLMPQPFLEKDLIKYEHSDLLFGSIIPRLAKKYQVSESALSFRLANLGYIRL
ncbi:MAG: ImmA/IrrE family metallo-endopeptidase [Pyrinomonadaceae bacterium]